MMAGSRLVASGKRQAASGKRQAASGKRSVSLPFLFVNTRIAQKQKACSARFTTGGMRLFAFLSG